ncbi:MarR family EPS-associated transcriptional regulator [Luminiphilus sp.]|nr:MarR family EPS-associated transcriptional regulator [Luminiphilus sp.]
MNNIATNTAQVPETSARDELRLKVLRALETNPELSQRQLAAELGVSLGGVNYALKALVERGFVKADNFRKSGNKVAYLYVLTPRGVAEKASLATAFLGRKIEEYELLKQEIEALQVEVGSGDSFGSGKGARS